MVSCIVFSMLKKSSALVKGLYIAGTPLTRDSVSLHTIFKIINWRLSHYKSAEGV